MEYQRSQRSATVIGTKHIRPIEDCRVGVQVSEWQRNLQHAIGDIPPVEDVRNDHDNMSQHVPPVDNGRVQRIQ